MRAKVSARAPFAGAAMNARQLIALGLPEYVVPLAVEAVRDAVGSGSLRGKDVKEILKSVVADPAGHVDHPQFGKLAQKLAEPDDAPPQRDIDYATWGSDIDQASHAQMRQACQVPGTVGGALMPDAHVGYGLPIGGVLATEGIVIPYAVGVDIACRMKLSILDVPPEQLDTQFPRFKTALETGTRFGVGVEHQRPQQHNVMDEDWTVTRITREWKDRAWRQLGTSGSGNHFVEFGVLSLEQHDDALELSPGRYTALLSHSGSRGAGAAVCSTYSAIAQRRLPAKYKDLGRLAWLALDTPEGQEYWQAMNLMGRYAAGNHAVIHREVVRLLGAEIAAGVENHHNFAWIERHGGRDVVVHRKGATPAGKGVLGVIPGSMASPAYVVKGRGEPASFDSASHGAGRRMSRTQATNTFNFRAVQKELERQGVHVLSAGSDEVPGVYKDIHAVMDAQRDLVDVIARFDPKIVKMCSDGSRAED
jgi:tRNA-splicing ligase RtcB